MLQIQLPDSFLIDIMKTEAGECQMGRIFILSAYQTTAAQFFEKLPSMRADLVLDIRLKNESQLCGFTKKSDLAYFVPRICHAAYIHDLFFAPDPDLLDRYLKHWIRWEQYAEDYRAAMEAKNAALYFKTHYREYNSVCLLGTATPKRRSHSEVLLGLLQEKTE